MKFLKKISSASEMKPQEHTVLYYNSETKSITVMSNKVTITFKDYDGSIISEEVYVYGETITVPSNPTREDYTFLGWSPSVADNATADMTYTAQYYVNPSVTITMQDSYEDDDAIACSASKNASVKDGSLVFTMNLANDIAELKDNIIIFNKHYEGNIIITATGVNKYDETNTVSDTKTITVSCGVADTTAHTIVDISTPVEVQAEATSATITYKCSVTTTKHDGTSQTVTSDTIEKVVTFEANEGEEARDIKDSFTCEHGETVEYTVKQEGKPSSPYEAVDLGLPSGLKWAKCNVGATEQEEAGMYFRWGETQGHYQTAPTVSGVPYDWALTPYYSGSNSTDYTKYTPTDGKTVLDLKDDAAAKNMGGSWRMPTANDFKELYENTTNEWVRDFNGSGVKGRKFTNKTDATKYIFIPAVGYCNNSSVNYVGSYGCVWSSSLDSSDPNRAYYLNFSSGLVDPQNYSNRCNGFSVRGVRGVRSE